MKLLSGKPGKITPQILAEQTRFSYEVFPITASMLAIVMLVAAYLIWSEIDPVEAGIWLLIATIVLAGRFLTYYLFKSSSTPDDKAGFWHWLFVGGACITALVLAAAGFLYLPDFSPSSQTLFMLLLIGLVSGSLPVLALNMQAYAAYIVIVLSPLIFSNLVAADIQLKLLGVLIIIYIVMLMLSGYLFSRAMMDSLIYRYRSQTLADRLQTSNQRLSLANEELQHISTLDELTGTYNRRYFNQRFQEVWADHRREGAVLSALMIDVDYFKNYNDNYGHLQGDNCLQRIAQEIMQVVHRPRDFVARFGGEEFIVLLPNTKIGGAKEIANRVHQRIERLAIPHKRPDELNRVTVSIGGASALPTGDDSSDDDFLQLIDRALYQAKNAGRNQSIFV